MNVLSKTIGAFVIILVVVMAITTISDTRIASSFFVGVFFSFAVLWPIFVNCFLSMLSSKPGAVSWILLGGSAVAYAVWSLSNVISIYSVRVLDPQSSIGLLFMSIDVLPYFIRLWIFYLCYWRFIISR